MQIKTSLEASMKVRMAMRVLSMFLLCGTAAAGIVPMPLISRGVPAFASSVMAGYHASDANSANYSGQTYWYSDSQPAWIAYDLSAVPASQRASILAVWYNKGSYGYYHLMTDQGTSYFMPGPYVIEGNTAAGGTSAAPSSGWTTLATSENPMGYKSHQHVIQNFAGNNWIRLRTLSGSPRNDPSATGCTIKFEIYDISKGVTDDWIIYGNSITANTWQPGDFLTKIHAVLSAYNPVLENGGVPGVVTASGVTFMDQFLPIFPGKFVCLCYGTNDANGNIRSAAELQTFYNDYDTIVQKVLAAGKVPIIGTIIWSTATSNQTNLQALNAKLDLLRAARPQIMNGPDLYAKFQGHPEWYQDVLHPNTEGMDTLESVWVQWALANVYSGAVGVERTPLKDARAAAPFSISVQGKTVAISSGLAGTCRLFDMLGNQIGAAVVQRHSPVMLQPVSRGVYFVRFEGSVACRIVIR